MNRLTQAKAARTRAWKKYERLNEPGVQVDASFLLAARARYEAAALALRVAEWEATGGPSSDVPRPE